LAFSFKFFVKFSNLLGKKLVLSGIKKALYPYPQFTLSRRNLESELSGTDIVIKQATGILQQTSWRLEILPSAALIIEFPQLPWTLTKSQLGGQSSSGPSFFGKLLLEEV
jgi:hypothetical protein